MQLYGSFPESGDPNIDPKILQSLLWDPPKKVPLNLGIPPASPQSPARILQTLDPKPCVLFPAFFWALPGPRAAGNHHSKPGRANGVIVIVIVIVTVIRV